MYMMNTKPDICFVVNTLIRYMMDPQHVHLVAAKHVMMYLKGTLDCGLTYATNNEIRLHGYTYSYWAQNTNDKKST